MDGSRPPARMRGKPGPRPCRAADRSNRNGCRRSFVACRRTTRRRWARARRRRRRPSSAASVAQDGAPSMAAPTMSNWLRAAWRPSSVRPLQPSCPARPWRIRLSRWRRSLLAGNWAPGQARSVLSNAVGGECPQHGPTGFAGTAGLRIRRRPAVSRAVGNPVRAVPRRRHRRRRRRRHPVGPAGLPRSATLAPR